MCEEVRFLHHTSTTKPNPKNKTTILTDEIRALMDHKCYFDGFVTSFLLLMLLGFQAQSSAQEACADASACNFGLPSASEGCLYPTDLFEAGHYKDCTGRVLDIYDSNANGMPDPLETVGCMNPRACNFNHTATSAGDCEFASCVGCMDENASNYNAAATRTAGNCVVSGCTDPESVDFDPVAMVNDGSCRYYDCYDPLACNAHPYDKPGEYISIACDYSCVGCLNEDACNYNASKEIHDGSLCDYGCLGNTASPAGDGFGCAAPEACNYQEGLKIHVAHSCSFATCTDAAACNFEADGGCHEPALCLFADEVFDNALYGCDGACINDADNDGICDENEVPGCSDVMACNFDPDSTDDDGSCDYSCTVCRDVLACNYASSGLNNPEMCDYSCGGCTKVAACNYDPMAAYNDGTCRFLTAIVAVNPRVMPPSGGWDLACHDDVAAEVYAHVYGPESGVVSLVWANGQTTNPATLLPPGDHSLLATHTGCSETLSISVLAPPALSVTTNLTSAVTCHGESDGAATATATGGTSPYSWTWSQGDDSTVATELAAGSYAATVTDLNGCTATGDVTVTQPEAIAVSIDAPQSISCEGGQSGIISAQPTGGVAPYSYEWNTGSTSATIGALAAGSFNVTVTDSNGCEASESTTLNDGGSDIGLLPHIGVKTLHHPACTGETGSAVIDTMLSLTPIEDIVWSHMAGSPAVRDSVGDLPPGEYLVTARAPSGCESSLAITIQAPETFARSNIRALPATNPNRPTGKLLMDVDGPEAAYEVVFLPSDARVAPRRLQFDNHLRAAHYGIGLYPGSYTIHNLRNRETGCLGADEAPDVAIVPNVRP